MAVDLPDVVDAISLHAPTDRIVLSLIDAWDWTDTPVHVRALQAKLEAYINFVVDKQLVEVYPLAIGRQVVIEVWTKYAMSSAGEALLSAASQVCIVHSIELRDSVA